MVKISWILFLFSINTFAQTWSTVGLGTNGRVESLILFDSALFVGGQFSTAGNIQSTLVAKWDGINWNALDSSSNNTGTVFSLCEFNNELYAGGLCNFNNSRFIAKWDGSEWSMLGNNDIGAGLYSLCVYNNELYVGGYVNPAQGVYNFDSKARWNGVQWSTVSNDKIAPDIEDMILYNNELYIGGNFQYVGNNNFNFVTKWDGSNWIAVGLGMNSFVRTFCIHNNELYAGGGFTIADSDTVNYVSKWNGSTWKPVGYGFNNAVNVLCSYHGELFAGGYFTEADNSPANHVAKWDGSNWSSLGSGTDNIVEAMCVFDSSLYIGGEFTQAGGIVSNHIARLNIPDDISELHSDRIRIFPNPVEDYLYISTEGYSIVEINLIDALGRKLISTRQNTINVNSVSMGLYFVEIKLFNGIITKKIAIN